MAHTPSGPWILEAAPFFVVVLMVAHVSALVYWIYRLASDRPPPRTKTQSSVNSFYLVLLSTVLRHNGDMRMNTEREKVGTNSRNQVEEVSSSRLLIWDLTAPFISWATNTDK
ncbi:hypothetical protein OPV22_012935 [Ensete ventricosum]|uniref:Transmembrane protein n=1 Tax=Ensete ventricosum TaxID=4639 RepID=A0AAV8PHJ8_ENSVE|nr:hypothetical protein OPV22_012935 [Ensete ventricosum]